MIPFLDELKLCLKLDEDQLHIESTFFSIYKCSNYFVQPCMCVCVYIYIYTNIQGVCEKVDNFDTDIKTNNIDL